MQLACVILSLPLLLMRKTNEYLRSISSLRRSLSPITYQIMTALVELLQANSNSNTKASKLNIRALLNQDNVLKSSTVRSVLTVEERAISLALALAFTRVYYNAIPINSPESTQEQVQQHTEMHYGACLTNTVELIWQLYSCKPVL